MKSNLHRNIFAICAAVLLGAQGFAAETNTASATTTPPSSNVTHEEIANNFLHIQERITESQLAIEKNQQSALEAARSNSDALNARIQALEKAIADQRTADADAARKTQQTTLFLAGAFGLAGLGIMLLMVYFQWRAFTQLAQISGQQHMAIANADAVHQLAAPGRATVETANAQLLDVVGRLEQRINELEGGQKMLPEIVAAKTPDPLAEGQALLDQNAPQKALEFFDKFLATHPESTDGLVKRAATLEKLGRDEDALASYNRAIAADNSLVVAHLHKGGLLNKLRRYDEALNCYEQALNAQDKKAK